MILSTSARVNDGTCAKVLTASFASALRGCFRSWKHKASRSCPKSRRRAYRPLSLRKHDGCAACSQDSVLSFEPMVSQEELDLFQLTSRSRQNRAQVRARS